MYIFSEQRNLTVFHKLLQSVWLCFPLFLVTCDHVTHCRINLLKLIFMQTLNIQHNSLHKTSDISCVSVKPCLSSVKRLASFHATYSCCCCLRSPSAGFVLLGWDETSAQLHKRTLPLMTAFSHERRKAIQPSGSYKTAAAMAYFRFLLWRRRHIKGRQSMESHLICSHSPA